MPYSYNKGEAQPVHLQSDQHLFGYLDEHAAVGIVNMVAKPQTKVYSLSGSCAH